MNFRVIYANFILIQKKNHVNGFKSTLKYEVSSCRVDLCFFSVAITTPSLALMPTAGCPALTALSAYSIWTSFPEGEKVVKENE